MSRHLHLLVALFVFTAPAVALAGKKVVVLDFEGKGHKSVRATVETELGKTHAVVPHAKVVSESRKLGIGLECNETNIMGMASIFGAEGVICGTIAKGKLAVSVYNGGDGKLVKKFKVPLATAGLAPKAVRTILRSSNAALAKTWNWDTVEKKKPATPDPKPAPTPDPEPDSLSRALDKPLPDKKPAPKPEPEDPEPVVPAAEDTEDPLRRKYAPGRKRGRRFIVKKKAKPTGRMEGRHALRLSVGPSFLFRRNFRFYNVYAMTAGHTKEVEPLTTGWETSPVGGIAIDAELYPGAWLTRGFGGNVGLGVSYNRYFGLSWRMSGDPESHSATHQNFGVDLRARYQLLNKPYLPLVFLMFGFQYSEFSMNDTSKDAMFPDVAFSSLDIGGGGEIGIVPRWLHLSAWFHYLPVLGRGEITKSDEWGAGSGGGWNVGGALRGKLWGPIGWRFEFDYTNYLVKFKLLPEENTTVKGRAEKAKDSYMTGLLFISFIN